MKNKFFLTTVLAAEAVFIGCVVQAQNIDSKLIQVEINGKWGYVGINKKQIEPQFERLEFSQKMAWQRLNWKVNGDISTQRAGLLSNRIHNLRGLEISQMAWPLLS